MRGKQHHHYNTSSPLNTPPQSNNLKSPLPTLHIPFPITNVHPSLSPARSLGGKMTNPLAPSSLANMSMAGDSSDDEAPLGGDSDEELEVSEGR